MDEAKLLQSHMEDLAQKAGREGCAHSGFLSQSEAAQVGILYKNRTDVVLQLDGGFEGAERQIAVFLQPDWGVYIHEETLAALALVHRPQDEVRHKDVLGAVLGLGLTRDVLGDIHIAPGRATLVCLARIAGFITQQLEKVARVGVTVQALPLADLPDLSPALTEKQLTVASLRLDVVTAAAFNFSRSHAAQAIAAGRVQLAHRECLNSAQPVPTGAIISVRGTGRVKLLAAGGETRKGRLRITLGYYE